MRKAELNEIKDFITYRANHVALVQRIGRVVFDMDFSDHDRDKIECNAEDLNLWALRYAMQKGEYHPHNEDKKILLKLAATHIKNQPHHPEHWDSSLSIEDLINNPEGPVKATRMSKKELMEMVSDWSACAIYHNSGIFESYNSTYTGENPKIIFTPHQKEFIVECLQRVLDKVYEEKLFWPGKKYDAKQVEPILDFNEALNNFNAQKTKFEESLNLLEESILDVPQKEYCKDLLDSNGKMKTEVRDQILDIIDKWKKELSEDFEINKIEAKGSLLSRRYNDTSDLDISLYTNLPEDKVDEIASVTPKNETIKGTEHPIDFYVLGEGESTPKENLDNIYDVKNNEWIKQTEEYKNEIPLDYTIQVCNFFINGCRTALGNFECDKVLFDYYNSLDPETHEISQEELKLTLEDKRKDLKADLDALRIALHMISSFRKEAYDKEKGPFDISINIESSNPHVTINENFAKILEKFGIKENLKNAIDACEKLLAEEGSLKEEVSSSAFAGMVPERIDDYPNKEEDKKDPLRESVSKTVAFCFGRNNPPTLGHLKMWDVLSKTKADDRLIYTSHTQDKKKNPLSYETKAALIEECLQYYKLDAIFVNTEARTFIDVLVDIFKKGYNNVLIVAGGDRIEELVDLARKYNDYPNKDGDAYHFDSIEGINVGKRDPDSDDTSGISATKMRQFAVDGDFESFMKYFVINDPYIGKDIYEEIRSKLIK